MKTASLLAALMLAAIATAGCHTGEYNEAVAARIAEIQSGAGAGGGLFEGTTEVKTGAGATSGTIKLPMLFASPTALQAADQGAQPPFVALPGFAYSFQQMVDAGGAQVPVYVYFAGVEAASTPVDQLKQSLQDEIGKANMFGSWEAVALTPQGGGAAVNVQRFRVSGMQDFAGAQAEGQFDLYLITTPANHVLIGWRAPKTAVDQLSFPAAAEASTATFLAAG